MKSFKSTTVLYLITLVAMFLLAKYGPPLMEFKSTPDGVTFNIWGVGDIILLFKLALKSPEKEDK